MKTFEEFKNETKNALKNGLLQDEYEDAEIEEVNYKKLNESYTGLSVRKKNASKGIVINLNSAYQVYVVEPDRFEEILQTIKKQIINKIKEEQTSEDFDWLSDYETVKKRLFIRVSSVKRNKDMLQKAPHSVMEDLAITYHIEVSYGTDGLMSTIINHDMLGLYGITKEQLHADAMKNAPKIFPIQFSTIEVAFSGIGKAYSSEIFSETSDEAKAISRAIKNKEFPMLFVISNKIHTNGASAIFYPGVMENLGKLFESDYYILPSSIHEMIVIPDNTLYKGNEENDDLKFMKDTVKEGNNMVPPYELLSDRVYHYSRKEKKFELTESFINRQKKGKNNENQNYRSHSQNAYRE